MTDLSIRETIFQTTFSQDLSAAALSGTTSFSTDTRLSHVTFVLSVATVQDLTIEIDSGQGAAFDTEVIVQKMAGSQTDFFYQPEIDLYLKDGDEIKVTMTNSGLPASTVSVVVTAVQE